MSQKKAILSRRNFLLTVGAGGAVTAAAIVGKALASRTGRATGYMLVVLHHGQKYVVGLLDGKRGVDAVGKGLHRPADRWAPDSVNGTPVATDALEVALDLPCQPGAVDRRAA